MRGLKTQEGKRFEAFFALVQKEAAKTHSVFFLDCGEGHEFYKEDMEGEDLRGWRVPEEKAAQFEQEWLRGEPSDEWEDNIEWAVWHPPLANLNVTFERYTRHIT